MFLEYPACAVAQRVQELITKLSLDKLLQLGEAGTLEFALYHPDELGPVPGLRKQEPR